MPRFNPLTSFIFGTFNVRGLTSQLKKQALAQDLQKHQIDICAIQETKDVKGMDVFCDKTRFICFQTEVSARGLGFGISRRVAPFLHRTYRHHLTDRIAVAEFRFPMAKRGWFEVRAVNVHAPTAPDTAKNPEERDKFYGLLGTVLDNYSTARGINLLLGDFNSKVGKRREGETCIGRYAAGRRNANGEALVTFAHDHNLLLANTCFMHPMRHVTTWSGVGFKGRKIWNQIDYIAIPADHKACLRQARAYAGIDTNTDHKLVLAKLQLRTQRILWKRAWQAEATLPFAVDNLPSKMEHFKAAVQAKLTALLQPSTSGTQLQTDRVCTIPASSIASVSSSSVDNTPSLIISSMAPHPHVDPLNPHVDTLPSVPLKRDRRPYFALPSISGTYKPRATRAKKTALAQELQAAAVVASDAESDALAADTLSPSTTFNAVVVALREAATAVLGRRTRRRSPRWTDDPRIVELSMMQKALRLKIDNENDLTIRAERRKERNELLRQLRKLLYQLVCHKADQMATEIEQAPDSSRCFLAAKQLRVRATPRLIIHDDQGHEVMQDIEKAEIIKKHFAKILTSSPGPGIEPFEGLPRPLQRIITPEEIRNVVVKLKNRRAPGHDEIAAEMLKASVDLVAPTLAQSYNSMFAMHQLLQLGHGITIPFPKPNKQPGPCASLRPITLLSVFRKTLALIVVTRAQPRFEAKLPPAQAGARRYRSTTDGVWVKRMLIATVTHFNIDIYTLGTDISMAFDRVDRGKLLDYFKRDQWMDEDQLRMTRVLLANTTLQVRVRRVLSGVATTNCGTIQGDALSMLAFVGYIAGAMHDVRRALSNRLPVLDQRITLPFETAYVDDLDRHSTQRGFLEEVLIETECNFAGWNLELNKVKTERYALTVATTYTRCPACSKRCTTLTTCCDACDFWWHNACAKITSDQIEDFCRDPTQLWLCPSCLIGSAPIRRGAEPWRVVRHLGSKLDTAADVDVRIQRAGFAYAELFKLWTRRDLVCEKLRLRLFKAFVLPHFFFNLAAQALTIRLEHKLDTAHRRLLRRLIGMVYPNKISNEDLYERTKSQPISQVAKRARWSYLGHILRRDKEQHPAAQAMHTYWKAGECCGKKLDATHCTLMDVLLRDLKESQHVHGLELECEADLFVLTDIALNRKEWERLVAEVCDSR